MQSIFNWIKKNKLEFIALLAILLFAAFLRLYKIDQYMTFLGDEGRDAIVIKKILTEGDLPFIGPVTSIGNMYLGPLYYYMMTIPMAIFWLNPTAAAAQVAIIGTLAVALVYFLSREWFGKNAAAVSSVLYAVSPVNIIYSRSSWNPNPAPFFALLAILGLYKSHKTGNFMWLLLTGVSLAFALQMHYLASILIPIIMSLWIHELAGIFRKKTEMKNFWKGTVVAIVAFLVLMSPLVMFDLKHDFVNFKAIKSFFTNRETTVNINPFNTLERVYPIYQYNLIERYITAKNYNLNFILPVIILIPFLLAIVKRIKKNELDWSYLALGLWFTIGILGLALYKQNIYDHYLGFLNPVPFILFGSLASIEIVKQKKVNLFIGGTVILLSAVLLILNLQRSPLKNPPLNQLKRTQQVAKFVINESGNKPFNFALLAKNNYDSAYQYYLDLYGFGPKTLPQEMTSQLYVVCEDADCVPINNPKYEIAAFGWAKIESAKEFSGVTVYRLVRNETGKP